MLVAAGIVKAPRSLYRGLGTWKTECRVPPYFATKSMDQVRAVSPTSLTAATATTR